jgi:sec-independent protein translocase protein TatB
VIDLGVSKIALIGAVALIVIGPEKLPKVARMVGTLIGKAQRYISDVKAEVNRSMDIDELKKMRETVEGAARDVENSIQTQATDFEKSWAESAPELETALNRSYPSYKRPQKNWRLKQGTTPNWYKARSGVRTKALSGAARVARFRPTRPN